MFVWVSGVSRTDCVYDFNGDAAPRAVSDERNSLELSLRDTHSLNHVLL